MANSRAPRKSEPAPVEGLDARRAALDLLTFVRRDASLDEALENTRSFDALDGADRAFARALAATVLRRQGALDHVIGAYLDRPLPKRASRAMDVLRLAGAQLLFLNTPDHAAVSTAVALVKAFQETQGYAGLVNAVARKIARAGPKVVAALPERVDTPGWLWRSWERAYGPNGARAVAAAHSAPAPLDLTPRDPDAARALAERLGGDVVLDRTVRLRNWSRVEELEGFSDGAWWVQDAAAALPARLLGDVAGKRVFDLCSAPGGKALQLAAAGATVVAVDSSGSRLKRLVENFDRCGLGVETIKEDAAVWAPDDRADAILLDAPCSATGTIRRHPDILRLKSEDDVVAMARLQSALIDNAARLLKPGGTLVFATCSLQPDEGEKQAAAALARLPDLARAPIDPLEIGGLSEAVTRDGDLRTTPAMLADEGGMDGFFAARFVKSDAAP